MLYTANTATLNNLTPNTTTPTKKRLSSSFYHGAHVTITAIASLAYAGHPADHTVGHIGRHPSFSSSIRCLLHPSTYHQRTGYAR